MSQKCLVIHSKSKCTVWKTVKRDLMQPIASNPEYHSRWCHESTPARRWPSEMSGVWNFSVRVQSWSDKIKSDPVLIRKIFENHQSDPVLIRQCQIMYFYFASWGERTNGAILPLANYDWLKAKWFQQCFCLMT